MAWNSPEIRSVAFVSLGCPKNLVDSERMLGLLAEDGLAITPDAAEADAIVINTCGFLEASKTEALEEVRRAVEMKRRGRCKRVVVAGCLVQRHKTRLLSEVPEIDRLVGVFDREHIVQAVRGVANPRQEHGHYLGKYHDLSRELRGTGFRVQGSGGGKVAGSSLNPEPRTLNPRTELTRGSGFRVQGSEGGKVADSFLNPEPRTLNPRSEPRTLNPHLNPHFEDDRARLRLTPRHYAYLRISEGCNQGCAFCTIPSIRGPMRSKPIEQILAEARELSADGAVELNLIGQDTTSYGRDIGYAAGLSGLLRTLDKQLKDVHWLRLMYAYPSCFTDEMIVAIADCHRVVKYVDMPLQHINDEVLNRMRRRTTRQQIESLLEKLRKIVPGIAIRTTFIAGAPDETDDQHAELVKFVREFGFDMMGVFPYSPEPGTPMGRMQQQVPDHVKRQRLEELMLTQQRVAFAKAKARVGTTTEVLVDRTMPRDKQCVYVARSQNQAPEIDSVTYVQGRDLHAGQFTTVEIVDRDGYDLIAQVPLSKRSRSLSVLSVSA